MKLKKIFKFKNFKKYLLGGLLFSLVTGLIINLNNTFNDDGVGVIKTKTFDINNLEFQKLDYYQSNRVFYVCEQDDYFILIRDSYYTEDTYPSIVNENGKFSFVEENNSSINHTMFIYLNNRDITPLIASVNNHDYSFIDVYKPYPDNEGSNAIYDLLDSSYGGGTESIYKFETNYEFFDYVRVNGEESATITSNLDFYVVEIPLANNDLAGQEIDKVKILLK